ncbi:hypothetical protein TWF694_007867 [Orbilia ellipsospora]|uniref:Uncharacterized protein n=1 Tax=Orbilia ellipsospora TaxID=2528407 RepID=A0AAV9XJG2_9PEZI
MKYTILTLLLACLVSAQGNSEPGYIGYSLSRRGDPNSVVYETDDTAAGVDTSFPPPDVFLNASVSVGEISIEVDNLSAKVDLSAQVLSLLQFNAGVDASVDRVSLLIQNVTAKVLLEARLANLVAMIDDVLKSIDLNPVLATLGQGIENVTDTITSALSTPTGGSDITARADIESFNLAQNILYSVNDYSGSTHTNRILSRDGSIIDRSLSNDGTVYSEKTVGNYKTDMRFNGYDKITTWLGKEVRELEYIYEPFPGLTAVSAIFLDLDGDVVYTQILAEARGGGSSTISTDSD